MDSALRTDALTGKTKQPDFLSGKIDVRQVDVPIETSTGIEPKPALGPTRSRRSSLCSGETVAKVQESDFRASQIHNSAVNT